METSLNEFKDQLNTKNPLKVDHSRTDMSSYFDSIEKPLEEAYDKIKSESIHAYDSSIKIVRQNPVKSLAMALGVGLAAGYLLKRRKL